MLEGRWEPWIEAGLASVVKPGMRFCDIGANFGYYTLLGAHWVGPEGRVYAFEANPEILRKLRKSVAVNGFDDRVTLFGNAVYSDHRTLEFRYTFEFSGGGSVSGGGGGPWTVHRVKVEAAPLDSLLADVSHVDVMKIDVEGAEPHVFRGARKLMARSRALSLVVEFHAASVAAVMDPRDYLQGFVADGFSLALIEPAGVTRALGVEECLATLNGRLGYLLLTRTG
nr:FkbM family methyltransferase [Caldovatus aquaticus]